MTEISRKAKTRFAKMEAQGHVLVAIAAITPDSGYYLQDAGPANGFRVMAWSTAANSINSRPLYLKGTKQNAIHRTAAEAIDAAARFLNLDANCASTDASTAMRLAFAESA